MTIQIFNFLLIFNHSKISQRYYNKIIKKIKENRLSPPQKVYWEPDEVELELAEY